MFSVVCTLPASATLVTFAVDCGGSAGPLSQHTHYLSLPASRHSSEGSQQGQTADLLLGPSTVKTVRLPLLH